MKHTTETKRLAKDINNYLIKRFGGVEPEWMLTITLLADNYDIYKQCMEHIIEEGVFDKQTGRKHPLLATCKDLQATISKQIQHLGISPYASSKINTLDDTSDTDLLKNILGED